MNDKSPSETVLAETPARALKMLTALGQSMVIRAALAARGYDDGDHQEGWELLLNASGYRRSAPSTTENPDVRRALLELDAWDEPNFRLIRATLERRHPEQSAFVFDNLEPQTGAAALVSVTTLLDRLDALENAPGRKATRKADHAALAMIAKRGITPEERTRLRGLVDTVRLAEQPKQETQAGRSEGGAEHAEALSALRAWYVEWSEVARAVVKRRDHLIRLGLAKRKPPQRKASDQSAPADT